MIERYQSQTAQQTSAKEFDAGLRSHMLRIYNYMTSGILLTAIVSLAVWNTPAIYNALIASQDLFLVFAFAPLAFVLVLSFGINKLSSSAAKGIFFAYAAVMGVSIGVIVAQFTGVSVARTFLVTAIAFASLSLYGYTTKRSLSGMGTFLMMGLVGLFVASIINIFVASTMLEFIISVAGVLIFAGLTAYDTQKLKRDYYNYTSAEMQEKGAIYGALSLCLDFINLFFYLLRFLGNRD